jgi:hypothetical protein
MALYNSVSNSEINAVQTSLTPPLFIEVPIPIQESERKFVLNASSLHFAIIFQYFFFIFQFIYKPLHLHTFYQ